MPCLWTSPLMPTGAVLASFAVGDYLTLHEAADRLSLTVDEMYRRIRRGDIPGVRTGVGRWYVHRRDVAERVEPESRP